jgi:hypothetical protein
VLPISCIHPILSHGLLGIDKGTRWFILEIDALLAFETFPIRFCKILTKPVISAPGWIGKDFSAIRFEKPQVI